MMHKLLESLAPVVLALKEAGITANIDPSKLNPPCAWVTPASLEKAYLDGAGDLTCDVWLITADTGVFDSYVSLETMLGKALTVLEPDGEIILNTGIEMSNGSVLPAFKFPIIVRTE